MEYDATYKFGKFGNSTVHVVAPEPKSQEEIDKILKEFHLAGWAIWEEIISKEYKDEDKG